MGAVGGIHQQGHAGELWRHFQQHLKTLGVNVAGVDRRPGGVAARTRQACDEPLNYRVTRNAHHDGNRGGGLLRRTDGLRPGCDDAIGLQLH